VDETKNFFGKVGNNLSDSENLLKEGGKSEIGGNASLALGDGRP